EIRETVDSLTRIQHEPRINLSHGLKGWIALHYKRIHGRNKEQGWWMRMEVLLEIHGVWDVEAIKTRNLGADSVKDARIQTLITEFETMKIFYNGTKDEYAVKLSGIASKSVTLGEVMSKHKLVKKFLISLPRHFVHIVAALEQVLDLKMTGFENVEEDVAYILEVVDEVEVKDVVGATRKTMVNVTPQKNVKIIGKRFVSKCPDRKRDYEANLSETHEGDVNHKEGTFFMMNHIQETIFINEEKYTPQKSESNTVEDNVWYFDNGASNHMTGKTEEQKLLKDVYYNLAFRSNVISLGQATIFGYDISIRGEFLTMRDSWGSLLIKVSRSVNRLYKAQLKLGKEAEKGWKIHHLDVKIAFLNSDRMKLDSTLKSWGFYNACTKRRCIESIEVSRGKDCIEIKQERYAMKILKEAGMEDCNATLCPMEPKLNSEFMAATAAACQAICLRELLVEVTGLERKKVIIRVDNKSGIALSKNQGFMVPKVFLIILISFIDAHLGLISSESSKASRLKGYLSCFVFRRVPRGGIKEEQLRLLDNSLSHIILPEISDRWTWNLESSGEFSLKSARVFIDDSLLPKANAATGWIKVVTIKINIFAWTSYL
nr:hypothetical protein [Tanacetum cinerariifolium]